jgi:Family of unknown function (DUF6492)
MFSQSHSPLRYLKANRDEHFDALCRACQNRDRRNSSLRDRILNSTHLALLKMYRIVFPGNRLNFAVLIANLLLTIWSGSIVSSNGSESRSLDTSGSCSLDAVVLTTGKDSIAFEKSIQSSLLHFLDVRDYYIVTPKPEELIFKFKSKPWFSSRIKIVGEDIFPFKWNNISEIMIQSVADKGIYPLDGNSVFEKTVYGRIGWFLQQLLKLYAGKVLGLNDFILLDSDVVWFNDIRFTATCNETSRSYYYASSCQYHPPYMASLGPISGVNPVESKVHRSGARHILLPLQIRHSLTTY